MSNGPRIAYLMPTGRCNLHCSGCYATLNHWGRHSKQGELTIDEYSRVIAELVEMGVTIFDISGGEPLLYPHLVELCAIIRSHPGTRIWLVNNGTVVKPAELEQLAHLVERFVISLDAPDAAMHDIFRGLNGAFAASVRTLRAARQLPFPEIAVNQLLCASNTDSVSGMFRLCRDENIDRLALLSYRDVSENGVHPELIPTLPLLKEVWQTAATEIAGRQYPRWVDIVVPAFLFEEAADARRRFPPDARQRITIHYPHLRGLSAYRETIVVKPFGVISGDTAMVNAEFFDAGHVSDGVRAVWEKNSPAWRERLLAREARLKSEAPCGQCARWSVCRGGCPAAALHQWGPEWRHDRSCDQFRAAGVF